MTKAVLKLPAFSPVAPGATAAVQIPITSAYAAIFLKLTSGDGMPMSKATMRNVIERIKLKIARNGKGSMTYWDVTGEQLIALNGFYGLPSEVGILPLYFSRPYFETLGAADNFALGTLDVSSVILEVTFSDTVITPTLEGTAHVFTRENSPLGNFIRLDTTFYNAAASIGIREIADLPITGPGIGLKGLHISTENISDVELQVNNADFRQQDTAIAKTINNADAFKTGGRHWQDGWTHFDIAGNRAGDIFPTAAIRDLRLKLNMTEASAFAILTETVLTPNA